MYVLKYSLSTSKYVMVAGSIKVFRLIMYYFIINITKMQFSKMYIFAYKIVQFMWLNTIWVFFKGYLNIKHVKLTSRLISQNCSEGSHMGIGSPKIKDEMSVIQTTPFSVVRQHIIFTHCLI